jgi:hypothetical protein
MPWWTKGTFIILLSFLWSCTTHSDEVAQLDPAGRPEQIWAEFVYGTHGIPELLDQLDQFGQGAVEPGAHDFELHVDGELPIWLDSLFQVGYTVKSDKGYRVYRPKDPTQRFRRIEVQPHPEHATRTLLFEPSSEF